MGNIYFHWVNGIGYTFVKTMTIYIPGKSLSAPIVEYNFQGLLCPFCMSYLRAGELGKIVISILGGVVIGFRG